MFSFRRFNFVVPGIGTRPMETPLTPLEFARRARKVYPEQTAVIDGDSRWSYAQFLDRCDRWSAVLQRLGVGRAIASPISRPILMHSWSRSTPCRNWAR